MGTNGTSKTMVSKIRFVVRLIFRLLKVVGSRAVTSFLLLWRGGLLSYVGISAFFLGIHLPAFRAAGVPGFVESVTTSLTTSYTNVLSGLAMAPGATGFVGEGSLLAAFLLFFNGALAILWFLRTLDVGILTLFGSDAPLGGRLVVELVIFTLFVWRTQDLLWWNPLLDVGGNIRFFLDAVPLDLLPKAGSPPVENVSSLNATGS